jgi:hypothetical protein
MSKAGWSRMKYDCARFHHAVHNSAHFKFYVLFIFRLLHLTFFGPKLTMVKKASNKSLPYSVLNVKMRTYFCVY